MNKYGRDPRKSSLQLTPTTRKSVLPMPVISKCVSSTFSEVHSCLFFTHFSNIGNFSYIIHSISILSMIKRDCKGIKNNLLKFIEKIVFYKLFNILLHKLNFIQRCLLSQRTGLIDHKVMF